MASKKNSGRSSSTSTFNNCLASLITLITGWHCPPYRYVKIGGHSYDLHSCLFFNNAPDQTEFGVVDLGTGAFDLGNHKRSSLILRSQDLAWCGLYWSIASCNVVPFVFTVCVASAAPDNL